MRGTSFTLAYNEATMSENNTELCAYVGSMLCDIFTDLRSSIEAALNEIGVRPHLVCLTSLACLEENEIPLMDMPTILVYFACCILHLFKKTTDEVNYKTFMSSHICELQEIAGCDPVPDTKLDIPFDFRRANAITTMLGSSSYLRADAIRFLVSASSNQRDHTTRIGRVCQYLCNKLSWCDCETRALTLMNDLLVKAKSPVLRDTRVLREVNNLNDARAVVDSHPFPQFFKYLTSSVELFKVEPSRFPTLIAVAIELQKGINNGADVAEFEVISTAGVDLTMVKDLVKLHRSPKPEMKIIPEDYTLGFISDDY